MAEKTILALDLAGRTGWALGKVHDRIPQSGSLRFAAPGASMGAVFCHFRMWLTRIANENKIDVVVFESPMTPSHMRGKTNITTIRTLMGLPAITEEVFFTRGLAEARYYDLREAKVVDIRRHFLGSTRYRRVAAKAMTIAACRRIGWFPQDDNAADALALWHYQASIFEPRLALQTSPLFKREGA